VFHLHIFLYGVYDFVTLCELPRAREVGVIGNRKNIKRM